MTKPRPIVTIHLAQTLDGRIAGRASRVRLSTREGFELAHRARAAHDAVLVGAQTVVIDDPLLTVRLCEGRQPLRVALASALAIPEGARLLDGGAPLGGSVLIIGAEGRATEEGRARLVARGAEVCVVAATDRGWVSLPHALAALHTRGIRRLLVEGGARVLTSFLHDRLVDFAEIEIAPRIFGDSALAAFGALRDAAPGAAISLRQLTVDRLGENILLRGALDYPA